MGWFKIIQTDLEWSDHLKQHVFLLRVFGAKETEIPGGILFYFDELPDEFRNYADEWFMVNKSFEELKQIINSL